MSESPILDIDKGAYLGSYTISRTVYYKKLSIIIFCMIVAAYAFMHLYTGDLQASLGAAGGALVFALITAATFNIQYFLYPFKIDAYAKGLEFGALGFFYWDNVFLYKQKRNNMLILKKGYLRNIEAKWSPFLEASIVRFQNWGDTDDSPAEHLLFRMNIPSAITNISYDEFLKLIDTKTKIYAPYDTMKRTKS